MWLVRFHGVDERSFQFLQNLGTGDEFEFKIQDLGNGNKFTEYFICVKNHEGVAPSEILAIAETQFKIYAALLKINGYQWKTTLDSVTWVNVDGTLETYLFLEDKINTSDSVEVFINGEIIFSSENANLEKNKILLGCALADTVKKELLILLGEEENWVNAYKIYEILKTHYKTEKELKKFSELESFAHTANSPNAIGVQNARHSVQSNNNPKKIASLETSYRKLIELALDYIKIGNN